MKVTTVNLSDSLDAVGPAHGTIERGEMTTGELSILLTEFIQIDPALNLEHDPRVLVRTRDAWYAIRTERGRLHLYDARDTSQPGAELDLAELVAVIENTPPAGGPADAPGTEPESARSPGGIRKATHIFAALLLGAGIGLNVWGVYQFLHQDEIGPPIAYTPLPEDEKTALYRHKLAGTYATGAGPGHRVITVTREGKISFDVLVQNAGGNVRVARGPLQAAGFGRRPNGAICLTAANSGHIAIGVDGSLVYFGDTYRRISTLAQ